MTASITLWESYLIESLRSKGMDNTTLLTHIEKGDLKALNDFDDSFDHADLIETKNSNSIKQAIESDYTVKFITINGIKNLLGMKFGLKEGNDFRMDDSKFYDVSLTNEQVKTFKKMISPLWKMVNVRNQEGFQLVDIVHSLAIR